MTGVAMRGVELVDARIDGEIHNLLVNGVDVAPLVNAELDRHYPDRAKMRPTDPAGLREAWDRSTCRGTRCRTLRGSHETARRVHHATRCWRCAATE
jgi:hypothetical protein